MPEAVQAFLNGLRGPARARAALLAMMLSAGACGESSTPVVIGYAFPPIGKPSVDVARSEVVERGRPNDRPILIVYDSTVTGDPADVEVERAHRFVATPGLVGIVGHGGSRGSLAAAPVYNEAEVPQIVPIGTSRLLADAGPWTFTLAPNDSTEGEFMAAYAVDTLHARYVTIVFENDEYGIGLLRGVSAGLTRRGVRILDELRVDPAMDVATLAEASFRRAKPDLIVSASRSRGTGIVAGVGQRHVPGIRVIAGDGASQPQALRAGAGAATDSIYVAGFWLADAPDSLSRAFVERFSRIVGREPVYNDAMAHDALMTLVTAVRTVGSDRGAIRRFLTELGHSRPPLPGITGPISFGPDRATRLVMTRIRGDGFVRAGSP